MKFFLSLSKLLLLVSLCFCVMQSENLGYPTNEAINYLSRYGYLSSANSVSGGLIAKDTINQAIIDFQSFAGIKITGILDNETALYMSMPRCGVKDKIFRSSGHVNKRYALQGSRWRVKTLTYKISKYPKNLNRESVDIEIRKAFSIWSNHTDLDFQHKKHGQVHIEIKFELGDHKDGDPFDGPGGTLAHAYFPVYGGDAHFDDSEQWTINSFRGTNLFQVAAHEFGHSLGLSHSDIRSSLMAPFYRGYDPNFILDSDDIHGIQALYGYRKMNRTETAIKPQVVNSISIDENLLLCSDSKIDTIFTSADGHTYVFKGQYFWKLSSDGINDAQPQLISTIWKGLPGNIDAAFTYKNGKTYFFKGSRYWRYIDKIKDGDYPKFIDEGFTGIPDNIDAVTVWTGNGKIYFYKGSKFWRFDPFDKPPVNKSYPKPIANWLNIPDHLDAAFSHHGYTYFFKDESYYRFNDRNFAMDVADPPFPRSTAYWWFGCRSVGKETLLNVQWKQIRNDNQSSYANKLEHKGIVFGDDSDYASEDNIALDELT